VDQISFQLDDLTRTALSNVSLPALPPDLSRWQQPFGFLIMGFDSNYYQYRVMGTVLKQ
jgi:hypothetical protein